MLSVCVHVLCNHTPIEAAARGADINMLHLMPTYLSSILAFFPLITQAPGMAAPTPRAAIFKCGIGAGHSALSDVVVAWNETSIYSK